MINILLCCAHSQDVLNTYCWIHSTYTIPSAFWKRIGFDVAHPGVDKTQDPLERRYHKYYQWVCFCLFFQVWHILILSGSCMYQYQWAEIISEGCAKSGCNNTPPRSHYKQKHVGMSGSWILHSTFQAILFYIPRWLWKNWEAGKVSALRMDLNLGIISDVEKKLKKKLLIDYLYSNLKHHNFWAYRYFFCEFLALLNVSGMYIAHSLFGQINTFMYVTGQMFLLDRFFDGTFFTYGIEVMSFADRDQEDRIDPMIYVFPR